jgi:hypothetical protein
MDGTTNLGMATRTVERMQTVSVGWSGYCLADHSCALSQTSCSDPASRNQDDLLCWQTPGMIALALAYMGWIRWWSVAELERDQSLSPLVKISSCPPPPPLGSPEDSTLGGQ